MGALKTSEQGDVVAGEGRQSSVAEDRAVDTGAKIIIGPGPVGPVEPVLPQRPQAPRPQRPPVVAKQGGLWLVILVYVLSASALAWAIYERFLAT